MAEAYNNVFFEHVFAAGGSTAPTLDAEIRKIQGATSTVTDTITMTLNENGSYIFEYTFTALGIYNVVVNVGGEDLYGHIKVVENRNVITTSNKTVKLKPVISSDYVTGGTESRTHFTISGVPSPNESVNGEYELWGLRNVNSYVTSTLSANVPMFTNGAHAIYAVTDTPTSGVDTAGSPYEWHICKSGSCYSNLIDDAITSVDSSGRELFSLDNVIFTGTGATIELTSADIMDTSSSYGSHSTSDSLVSGTAIAVTADVQSHMIITVTKHTDSTTKTRTVNFDSGLDYGQVIVTVNNNIIDMVNSDPVFSGAVDFTSTANNYVDTNQPHLGLWGAHISADNTNGTGTVSAFSIETENTVVNYAPAADIHAALDSYVNKDDYKSTSTGGGSDLTIAKFDEFATRNSLARIDRDTGITPYDYAWAGSGGRVIPLNKYAAGFRQVSAYEVSKLIVHVGVENGIQNPDVRLVIWNWSGSSTSTFQDVGSVLWQSDVLNVIGDGTLFSSGATQWNYRLTADVTGFKFPSSGLYAIGFITVSGEALASQDNHVEDMQGGRFWDVATNAYRQWANSSTIVGQIEYYIEDVSILDTINDNTDDVESKVTSVESKVDNAKLILDNLPRG